MQRHPWFQSDQGDANNGIYGSIMMRETQANTPMNPLCPDQIPRSCFIVYDYGLEDRDNKCTGCRRKYKTYNHNKYRIHGAVCKKYKHIAPRNSLSLKVKVKGIWRQFRKSVISNGSLILSILKSMVSLSTVYLIIMKSMVSLSTLSLSMMKSMVSLFVSPWLAGWLEYE